MHDILLLSGTNCFNVNNFLCVCWFQLAQTAGLGSTVSSNVTVQTLVRCVTAWMAGVSLAVAQTTLVTAVLWVSCDTVVGSCLSVSPCTITLYLPICCLCFPFLLPASLPSQVYIHHPWTCLPPCLLLHTPIVVGM